MDLDILSTETDCLWMSLCTVMHPTPETAAANTMQPTGVAAVANRCIVNTPFAGDSAVATVDDEATAPPAAAAPTVPSRREWLSEPTSLSSPIPNPALNLPVSLTTEPISSAARNPLALLVAHAGPSLYASVGSNAVANCQFQRGVKNLRLNPTYTQLQTGAKCQLNPLENKKARTCIRIPNRKESIG